MKKCNCNHEWVKYPRDLNDPTHPLYGKGWKERFKLENMVEGWVPVGTEWECRLCGEFRSGDEVSKKMHEEILKEIAEEKSQMSKWQRLKKWLKGWIEFGGF